MAQGLPYDLQRIVVEAMELDDFKEIADGYRYTPDTWCTPNSEIKALTVPKPNDTLSLLRAQTVTRAATLDHLRNIPISFAGASTETAKFTARLAVQEPTNRFSFGVQRWNFATSDREMVQALRSFLGEYSARVQTLFIDMNNLSIHLPATLPFLPSDVGKLSQLTTFVYSSGVEEGPWIDIESVSRLLSLAPNLKLLSLFKLRGSAHLPDQVIPSSTGEMSRLEQLCIRRVSDCQEADLALLVANSHASLAALVFTFDTQPDVTQSQSKHRGISALDFQRAFAPCTSIRVLMVSDLVCPTAEEISKPINRTRGFEPIDDSLGPIADGLVLGKANLVHLHLVGTIFSQDLFDKLRELDCRLRTITIHRFKEFPIARFIEELLQNPAFSELRGITFDQSDLVKDSEEVAVLSLICQHDEIRLEIDGLICEFMVLTDS